jgi:uncharacterized membrane protein YkvA (DUF1232 family)
MGFSEESGEETPAPDAVAGRIGRFRVRLGALAKGAKRDGLALYLAARDPRVPWAVKAFAALVAAYVLSPIDLIPDFIPVIGFLDELLLLPLAVAMIVRIVDPKVMAELRADAERLAERPTSTAGALLIVGLWTGAAWLVWRALAG